MPLRDMIGNEFHTRRQNQPLIVRNDPRDSRLMREWWAFKESCIERIDTLFIIESISLLQELHNFSKEHEDLNENTGGGI